MKSSICFLIIFSCCFFLSCHKGDVIIPDKPYTPPCGITRTTSIPFDGLSYGNGMLKTFDDLGLVTSVATAISVINDDVDSVYYTMKWKKGLGSSVVADITAIKKAFAGAVYPPLYSLNNDVQYTIRATFSMLNGKLLRISSSDASGNTSFNLKYNSKGKLTDFGNIKLDYDQYGNITRVPRRGTGGSTAIIYEYNLSYTAPGRQLYFGSGYNVHELYNLAEICAWIPVEPVHVRTGEQISWTNNSSQDYIAGRKTYSQQEFGDHKLLTYVTLLGDTEFNVSNFWLCRAVQFKTLP